MLSTAEAEELSPARGENVNTFVCPHCACAWTKSSQARRASPDAKALDLNGATQRVDHAPELSQQTIASGLDDPSAVFLDLRIQQVAPKNLQPGERPFFIRAHKPAVAGDVGSKNGGKAAATQRQVQPCPL